MKVTIIGRIVVVAAIMLSSFSVVNAQRSFSDRKEVLGRPADPVRSLSSESVEDFRSTQTKLDGPRLRGLLEQLGYQPTQVAAEAYEILINPDGWQLPVIVELSPNKKVLWISVSLVPISEFDAETTEKLINLMAISAREVRSFFRLNVSPNGDEYMLCLTRSYDNLGISATVLRRVIDEVIEDAMQTESYWNFVGHDSESPPALLSKWQCRNSPVPTWLEFYEDNTFALTTADGSVVRGVFEMDGQRLILRGSTGTVVGKAIGIADDYFMLHIDGMFLNFKRD